MVKGKEHKCQFLHFTKLRDHLCNCSSTLFGKYCSTNMKLSLKGLFKSCQHSPLTLDSHTRGDTEMC